MRSLWLTIGVVVTLLAACTGESGVAPSGPSSPPGPDLTSQAFHLVLDAQTGRVEVVPPTGATMRVAGGPSFSLIGADGVRLDVYGGGCAAIPGNAKQKRCSFDLELTNRMSVTDLVTPTQFPHPPQGVTGIMVFPWTASAIGGAGQVIPNADWDRGPMDFFNDFGGCSSGGKSDCYRYELFHSPLYAEERTAERRRVGYDIPIGATGVSAYIVVAADLRNNRPFPLVLPASRELCGNVNGVGSVSVDLPRLFISLGTRIVCGFPNGLSQYDPAQYVVASATLRLYGAVLGLSTVEQVDFGSALEAEDYGTPAIRTFGRLFDGTDFSPWTGSEVTTAVREGHDQGAPLFQFRVGVPDAGSAGSFEGTFTSQPGGLRPTGPQLLVQLKRR
jgi:hypothetical protein